MGGVVERSHVSETISGTPMGRKMKSKEAEPFGSNRPEGRGTLIAEGGGRGRGSWSGEGVPGETGRGSGRVGGKWELGVGTGVEVMEGEGAEGLLVGGSGDGG